MISSMISRKKAVCGKTGRGCDSCITKRARWYCASDDAFLCQACDSSVHSANLLARRHERVYLKNTGSFKQTAPSWHRGFTKKARTVRHGRHSAKQQSSKSGEDKEELAANGRNSNPFYLVPEVISDENLSREENEEHLLYRVPTFDPFMSNPCNHPSPDNYSAQGSIAGNGNKAKEEMNGLGCNLHMFIPSDMELAEFAADVESLLGRGLEDECTIGMEELGLVDTKEEDSRECSVGSAKLKVEDEVPLEVEADFEFNFDYDSLATCEEEKKPHLPTTSIFQNGCEAEEHHDVKMMMKNKNKILLNLDYDAVITAWTSTSQGSSPWTNGDKPNIDLNDCWPHCMGSCGLDEVHRPYIDYGGVVPHPAMLDLGREARVSRYREKRRTRLFSKKIRYEVRKLNAEKRPRMKGRFVKRTSFTGSGFTFSKK